jgi:hypothetical protein
MILLERKISGEELDFGPRIDIINDFLDKQIDYFEEYVKNVSYKKVYGNEILNELFRNTFESVTSDDWQ